MTTDAAVALAAVAHADDRSVGVEQLRRLVAAAAAAVGDDNALWEAFYGVIAMHPSVVVRAAGLDIARQGGGSAATRSRLAGWLVHDPHDVVAMRAASLAARSGVHDAIAELFMALGNSATSVDGLMWARTDLRRDLINAALSAMLASTPERASIEKSLAQVGYESAQEASNVPIDTTGMTMAASGMFLIDQRPVTTVRYSEFVDSVEQSGHLWCHWGEPPNYDHRPCLASVTDCEEVTGVSWFDAFAFASWRHKRLPTSAEWTEAASATEHDKNEKAVPPPYVNARLSALEAHLEALTDPAHAGGPPGRRWEWTHSRHLDVGELKPFVGRRRYDETIGDWTLYAVVHGGTVLADGFTAAASYRGCKHVMHKSPEMTFRCVADAAAC